MYGTRFSLWRTKFHKERLVPFSPVVAKKLVAYRAVRDKRHPVADTDEPFFPSRAGRCRPSSTSIPR